MQGWLDIAAGPLLVFVSALAATRVGAALARADDTEIERRLWSAVATGLVAARVGYVWQFHAAYLAHPWSALDLRDGGWGIEWGFVAAWLMALRHAARRPALKRPIVAAAASGTLLWLAGTIALYATSPDRGGVALPALTLDSPGGQPVDLRALKGKPVVLNLWATWCPPCNREMPVLAQAQAEHPEIQFVFVNEGEPSERVSRWLLERGLTLRNVVLDTRQQAGALLGQRAFPTTWFFDAGGTLVGHRIGELSPATLADHVHGATTSHR